MFLPFSGFRKMTDLVYLRFCFCYQSERFFGANNKYKEKETRDNFPLFPCEAYQMLVVGTL